MHCSLLLDSLLAFTETISSLPPDPYFHSTLLCLGFYIFLTCHFPGASLHVFTAVASMDQPVVAEAGMMAGCVGLVHQRPG